MMPGGTKEAYAVARFLADNLSPDTYLHIMGQYRPCGNALQDATINRHPSIKEMDEALQLATQTGMRRVVH